jgi:hypothetical protein
MKYLLALCALALVACDRVDDVSPATATTSTAAAVATGTAAASVAICDFSTPKIHNCTEIRDPKRFGVYETNCKKLPAASFVEGDTCPSKGRVGACLLPDESAMFIYGPATVEEARGRCAIFQGTFAAGGKPPAPAAATPYSCLRKDGTCSEETSVIDLTTTPKKQSCETSGGNLEPKLCPTANVVGRCTMLSGAVQIFYAPKTAREVKHFCAGVEGTYVGLPE